MTSDELADKVADICAEATIRIRTVGDEQYAIKTDSVIGLRVVQRTEIEDLPTHLKGLEEELMDVINHAAMTILRIRSMR